MHWSTSVLASLSSDTEPTIIVSFDSAKYIFNVGENTNRVFVQSKANWKKTRGLFFTDVGTKRSSGLAGLLMTFGDSAVQRLHIVGPPGLLHFMSAMRMYTYRDTINIKPIESSWNLAPSASPEPLFKDVHITVYGIPISPSYEGTISTAPVPVESSSDTSETGLKRKREASPDRPEKRLSLDNSSTTSSDERESTNPSPELLKGEAANDWRRLMIQTMFPGTKVKPEQITLDRDDFDRRRHHKLRKKGRASPTLSNAPATAKAGSPGEATANVDPYRRARLPPGFHSQLPQFVRHAPSPQSPLTPTLAYVIVGPRVRGKFDAKAAEALGVPSGPLRAQLTKGNPVTFKVLVDGEMVERTVRPEEVIGASESPGTALVLDIPTVMHIPALLAAFEDPFYAKFRSHRPEDFEEYSVRCVFHLLGKDVLKDPRYASFMNGFSSNIQHVISSREHLPDPVTFTSAAFNQLRMNQLDPEIFPLPHFSLSPKYDFNSIPNLPAKSSLLTAGQTFNMRVEGPPSLEKTTDAFHQTMITKEPPVLSQKTSSMFVEAKKSVEACLAAGNVTIPNGAQVKVIPLGTGSASPTKYRNVSSTLIQIPDWGNILLDAGEGTWGQLVRQFGLDDATPNNVWSVLRDLKCIFISHVHGDHHMGLAQILMKRRHLKPLPSSPLYLVTIRSVHLYIRELSQLQDLGLDDPSGNGVIPIMSESLHWKKTGAYQTYGMWQIGGSEPWTDITTSWKHANAMCEALGLEDFSTVDVLHKTRCYGAVIKHQSGWSIAFSGDTEPTTSLPNAGRNATLLIHEATMADDQAQLASQKAHSTFGQALSVARRMNAEHVLLTHFSARYPKMPPSALQTGNGDRGPVMALAFDQANFKIGDMWKANHYLRALEQSFIDTVAEEGDEEEEEGNTLEGMDVAID